MLTQTTNDIVTNISPSNVKNLINDIYSLCNEKHITIGEFKQVLSVLNNYENNSTIKFSEYSTESLSELKQTSKAVALIRNLKFQEI